MIMGFVIAQGIVLMNSYLTTVETRRLEEIKLARDMYNEFYSETGVYRKIANSIEACEKLYKSWGGPYDHNEINKYLGFFSDLGYFHRRGVFGEDPIAHFFGPFIVEAHNYPEIRKYVDGIRKNFAQPEAFSDFYSLALVIERERRFRGIKNAHSLNCSKRTGEVPK